MKKRQIILKRLFDFTVSLIGILFLSWLFVVLFVIATISTRANGFFCQKRIGKGGKPFSVIKFRTMVEKDGLSTNLTTEDDPRITRVGRILRKTKLDELPQLFNIVVGDMSFVGPRPDVPGFADRLEGEERIILTIRPGVTGPATLAFADEERILAKHEDPEKYNAEVIWPEKIRLNMKYSRDYSFFGDIGFILKTLHLL